MSVHLHIDHVVVEGIDCAGLSRIAIESQLLRSLETQLRNSGMNIDGMQEASFESLEAPQLKLSRQTSSFETGHSIAASLHSLIGSVASSNSSTNQE